MEPELELIRVSAVVEANGLRLGPDEQAVELPLEHRKVDLPIQDFWMFDDEVVVNLNYRVDGTQVNRELLESDLEQYHRWRDIALKESVPFSEYRAGASEG